MWKQTNDLLQSVCSATGPADGSDRVAFLRYCSHMEPLPTSRTIYVGDSKMPQAGRGVFAASGIRVGETIESCPIILMGAEWLDTVCAMPLRNYFFRWGEGRNLPAIALGFGSIYNHSYEPNARYIKRINDQLLDFVALHDIAPHEEIMVNYHGEPDNKGPLWEGALPLDV
jgi:uncharacterized protein